MKKFYFLSLLAFLLAALSCAPKNNDVEEPSLTLSQTDLSFDKAKATKSVSITTNQNKWIASSPKEGEWVMLRQNGNELEVSVTANTMGKARKTTVLVTAGGAVEKISISQSAADVTLEAAPEAIAMPQKGGKMSIDISSNTEEWTAKLDQEVDWLSFRTRPQAGEIVIEAQPNESSEARQVKLIATSGKKIIEVPITQEGLQKYLLPIFINKDNPSFDAVIKKEIARGSIMKAYGPPSEFFGHHFPGNAEFLLASDIIPSIVYEFDYVNNDPNKAVVKTITMTSYNYKEIASDEFKKFLKDNGYKEVSTKNKTTNYVNEEKLSKLAVITEPEVGATLTFTNIIKQDKDYPTFNAFPYEPARSFVEVHTKKIADVKAFEEQAKSTVAIENKDEKYPEEVEFLAYNTEKKDHWIFRAWFFYTTSQKEEAEKNPNYPKITDEMLQSAQEMSAFFDDPHLALFEAYGEWHLTKEFEALMQKEGFEFIINHPQAGYIFNRASDHLALTVKRSQYKDVAGGMPTLEIHYFYKDFLSNSSNLLKNKKVSISDARQKDFIEMSKRVRTLDKYLK